MSWRTVIIQGRSKLDFRLGYLVVRSKEIKKVFLDEVALLVIENPAVSMTGSLIEALTEKKIKVIFCDSKRNPVAELIPHHGSHDSSLRIKRQIAWSSENKELVWQNIIRDKISKQADFLWEQSKLQQCRMLREYAAQVEPGDATNREGHAAKVYFNALFGMAFTRGSDSPVNAALNYGYSILLSAVNREISACGCLTQLGVFHDNQFNHFNLGCDLMEPFRILIDRKVVSLCVQEFSTDMKRALWMVLNQEVLVNQARQTVLNAIKLYVRNVIDVLNEEKPQGVISYRLK